MRGLRVSLSTAKLHYGGGFALHTASSGRIAHLSEIYLRLDDGETVHLFAGDIVVQQATRHGWRNKGQHPATIAFVMLGAAR